MSEEWRQIEKCPEYEINRKGDIRRISDGRPVRTKAQKKIYGGYVRAGLYANGVSTQIDVHRAVAIAFIPNPENKKHVHHIDGDKTNNAVYNLAWVTRAEHGRLHKKIEDL